MDARRRGGGQEASERRRDAEDAGDGRSSARVRCVCSMCSGGAAHGRSQRKSRTRVRAIGFVVLCEQKHNRKALEAGSGQINSNWAELFGRKAHMSGLGETAEIRPKIVFFGRKSKRSLTMNSLRHVAFVVVHLSSWSYPFVHIVPYLVASFALWDLGVVVE